MSQFPWNNSTSTIAEQLAGQFETPKGSQEKADIAEKNAKDTASTALAAHTSISNPSAHTANNIVQDATHRFVTDTQVTSWDNKANSAVATPTTNGLISSTDKDKLDKIQSGAQVNQNAFSAINGAMATAPNDTLTISGGVGIAVTGSGKNLNITATGTATPGPHASTHITGGTDVIPDATANGNSGLFSGSDKSKLDGIQNGANNYVHPATHPPSIIAQDSANRFVTDTQVTSWDAKETTSGAQTKANTAETNAKNASLPLTGGKLTGDVTIEKAEPKFILNHVNSSIVMNLLAGADGNLYLQQITKSNSSMLNFLKIQGDGTLSFRNDTYKIIPGTGNPEGAVSAPQGSLFMNSSGGTGTTLYVKQSGGAGNTGWVGK